MKLLNVFSLCIAMISILPDLSGQDHSQLKAVEAHATREALIAAERLGALHLRDLEKRFGVQKPELGELEVALNQAIAQWVYAHPAQEQEPGQERYPDPPDFKQILQLPVWTEAIERVAGREIADGLRALIEKREQRYFQACMEFIRVLVAAQYRLTASQAEEFARRSPRVIEWWREDAAIILIGGFYEDEFGRNVKPDVNLGKLIRQADGDGAGILTDVQFDYPVLQATRGSGRDGFIELLLECERIRLLCVLDEHRTRLLRACGVREGSAFPRPQQTKRFSERLPSSELVNNPFWVKVRDTLLTDCEKALLADHPAVDRQAVLEARVELSQAQLDCRFHLDPEQMELLHPLVERVAEQDMNSQRINSLDTLKGFGIVWEEPGIVVSPEQRAARQAIEDVLDPVQCAVARDIDIGL